MFLIVGLGNPGREYMDTRHNVGFMALDALSREYGLLFQTKSRFNSQLALGENNSESVVLCKPETYMNLSGEAVQPVSAYYKISLDKIIVIHDDIDLHFGKISYKMGGGSGGHNGSCSARRGSLPPSGRSRRPILNGSPCRARWPAPACQGRSAYRTGAA